MIKATVFSLVIPCFNEYLAIPQFLIELNHFKDQFRHKYKDLRLHVIFIDNNSTDQSKALLSNYCESAADSVLSQCHEQGYGAALKFGFSVAKADFYGFVDLDQTYPLENFLMGLDYLLNNEKTDILMTNRFSETSKMPWLRNLGNQFFAILVNSLFSVKMNDVCSGQRIIRQRKIQNVIQLLDTGLNFSIELTCTTIKDGWVMHCLPIQYNERTGDSKLSVIKDGLQFLKTVIRVKFFT
jgi:glycosyltransferase involved in cell wall biosynthesis